MLSDLHIEMAFLSAIVKWLDNSEWVNCLSESTITTRGVADSFHGVRGSFKIKVCSLCYSMFLRHTNDKRVHKKKSFEKVF